MTKPKGSRPILARLAVFKLDGFITRYIDGKKTAVDTLELLVVSPARRVMRVNCIDILGSRRGFKATFLNYSD